MLGCASAELESRELDREHRVAARGRMDAGECRARQVHAEAGADDVLQRARAHRAERELAEPARRVGVGERERIDASRAGADCRQQADPRLGGPAQCEREHPPRGGIEPLGVVDRDEQRRLESGELERREGSAGEREPVRPQLLRFRDAERDLEGRPLRRGELGRDLREHVADQIGQGAESDRHLDLRAPRLQHSERLRRSSLGPRAPECRLADARAARDQQRCAAAAEETGELVDSSELGVAADELGCQTNAFSPVSARPISSFWIWDVPSYSVVTRASRRYLPTGYSST